MKGGRQARRSCLNPSKTQTQNYFCDRIVDDQRLHFHFCLLISVLQNSKYFVCIQWCNVSLQGKKNIWRRKCFIQLGKAEGEQGFLWSVKLTFFLVCVVIKLKRLQRPFFVRRKFVCLSLRMSPWRISERLWRKRRNSGLKHK